MTLWILSEIVPNEAKYLLGVYESREQAYDAYDKFSNRNDDGIVEVKLVVLNDTAQYY